MNKNNFDIETAIRNLKDGNSRIENYEDHKDWLKRKIEKIDKRLDLIEQDIAKIIKRP
jgi:prefoldin subunit 5